MSKVDIPAKDPISAKPIVIDPEVYTETKFNIDNVHEVFKALILSSLNG